MRRKDTSNIGRQAEDLASNLLAQRGFNVRNLNDERANYPLYDLVAEREGHETLISVKCARAKRELRLGGPNRLEQLSDECVVMAFIPFTKGQDISFGEGGYQLMIIPGCIARDEALAAHHHYAKFHPGSANYSVMVKDKVDRNPTTRSGAVFSQWLEKYTDAWDVFV
jgi:hypothetical protein